MNQEAYLWAQLVLAVAAAIGLFAGLIASRLISNSWLKRSKAGEWITLALTVFAFAFAYVSAALTWKAAGCGLFFLVLTLGMRRPRESQAGSRP